MEVIRWWCILHVACKCKCAAARMRRSSCSKRACMLPVAITFTCLDRGGAHKKQLVTHKTLHSSASKVFWNNSFSTSRRRLFVSIVSRFTRRRNERTSVATRKQRINQSCEVQGGAHACRLALDGTLAVQHGVQKNASVG